MESVKRFLKNIVTYRLLVIDVSKMTLRQTGEQTSFRGRQQRCQKKRRL